MSKRFVALSLIVLASMLALTACGGGSSSSSSSSSSTASPEGSGEETSGEETSSTTPSGEPIKLMAAGPIESPAYSLPSIPVGAEIAAEEINAEGGIEGRPVEIIACNEENNPNAAVGCARQAITENVVALVGGLSVFDLKMIPDLEKAGISWIGNSTPDAYSQKNVWNIGGDGATGFAAFGAALVERGCKNVAVVLSAAGVEASAAQIEAGVTSEGGKVVSSTKAPSNSSDWAPLVAAAHSAGAECIAAGTGPPETGPLLGAVKAGPKMSVGVVEGGLPSVVLKEVGALANGVIATGGYLPNSSTEGVIQELGKKSLKKAPKASYDQFTKTGYAGVKIVQEAAKNLDEVTAEALTEEGLPSVTNYDTGVGPVVDLSKPSTVEGYERIFNPNEYVLEAQNGEYVLAEPPNPLDMTKALEILAEG